MILNLMPCVFPVLSIKALQLITLREKGAAVAARSGFVYTAGVLASFTLIGAALIGIRAAGGDPGWGFQLQNPVIVLALAQLLFVIGLNLSGLFEISGSFAGIGSTLTARNGMAGTFFTGVLAALVATPCTAPFMAGAVGYAFLQPPVIAMAVFLALGFGLALPYLLLSLVPSLTALLPRPGSWMVKFRECLAFPVYLSVAWLLWVLSRQTGAEGVFQALTGLVAIAFALWLLAHRPARKTRRAIIVALALLACAYAAAPYFNRALLPTIPLSSSPPPSASVKADGVEPYTAAKLAALLAGPRPVFAYMTASWCISCKVNEKIAINTTATQSLFRNRNVAVLEGDWTRMDPEITAFLKDFNRRGVPLYVFYGGPDAKTGKRPAPVVLPQILTPGIIAATVKAQ